MGDADRRVLALCERLLDRPPEEVGAALAGEPDEIRDRVLALLEVDAADDEPLGGRAGEEIGWVLAADLASERREARGRDPDGSPALPEYYGSYRVIRRIGAGGMGVVYEAEQAHPRRRVALKVLHADASASDLRERMLAEAQALADLGHPAIPQVVEVGEQDGVSYLVMERIDGVPLDRWAAGRPVRERLDVVVALCRAVQHAHDVGVVHGDLKPANVLVSADGTPRVVDFGLARRLDDEGEAATAGTLPYLAPEVLAGGTPDGAADVFALGVLLYEVLCAALPFHTGAMSVTGERKMRARLHVVLPSTLGVGDGALDAVVERALAARSDRYARPGELADELARWLGAFPVVAYAGGPAWRGRLWLRRHRRAVGLMLTIVLLLAGSALGPQLADLWWEAARERRAAALLAPLEARLDGMRTDGRSDEIGPLLDAWATLPEIRRTRAIAGLLRREAEARRAAGDVPGALRLLARAHTETEDRAERTATALALARAFDAERDGVSLRRVLKRLPPAAAAGPEVRRLALRAAAGLRDLEGAASLADEDPIEPVLAALTGASRTEWRPIAVQSTTWEGQPRIAAIDQDGGILALLSPTADLRTLETAALPPFNPGFDLPALLELPVPTLLLRVGGWDELELHALEPGGWRRTWAGGLPAPIGAAHAVDLDGDGRSTLYVGTASPTRRFLALPLEAEDPDFVVPHAGTDRMGADSVGLTSGDLDGDGRPELIASFGPWTGFEVRVFRPAPDDLHLEMIARLQLGGSPQVAVLPGSDGRSRIAVVKSDEYPSDEVLGSGTPYGAPAGLYLLRLEGERLVPDAYLPLPVPGATANRPPIVGDLDGDGLADLVLPLALGREDHAWVVRQLPGLPSSGTGSDDHRSPAAVSFGAEVPRPARSHESSGTGSDDHRSSAAVSFGAEVPRPARSQEFAEGLISGLVPLGVAQLDDHPADALLVRLPDDDHHLWVMGAGEDALPLWRPARGAPPRVPELPQARELVELGLVEPAAHALTAFAGAETDPARAAQALADAGMLLEWLGRHDEASARFAHALDRLGDRRGALYEQVAAARSEVLEARHRFGDLPPGDERAALDAVSTVLDLTGGLPPRLDVRNGDALQHVPGVGLRLHAIGADGLLFTVPLEVVAGRVAVEVELETTAAEPGAHLRLELVDAEDRMVGALGVEPWGGAGRVDRTIRCHAGDMDVRRYGELSRRADLREDVRLRLDHARGRTLCVVARAGRTGRQSGVRPPITGGAYRLIARMVPPEGYSGAELRGTVRRITLTGAVLREEAADGPERDAASGRLLAGLAAHRAAGRSDRALSAAIRAGRLREAAALVEEIEVGAPEVRAQLIGLLRRFPEVTIPLLHARDPALLAELYTEAWLPALQVESAQARASLAHPLIDDLPVVPWAPALWRLRADLLLAGGDSDRAAALLRRVVAEAPRSVDRARAADALRRIEQR